MEVIFPGHGLVSPPSGSLEGRVGVDVGGYDLDTHKTLVVRINFLEGEIRKCEGEIVGGAGGFEVYRKMVKLQGELISRLQEYTEVKKSAVAVIPVTFTEVPIEEVRVG